MDTNLFMILRNAISFFPAALICILSVKNHLRFSKRIVYPCMGIITFMLAIIVNYISVKTGIVDNTVLFLVLFPILFCYLYVCKVDYVILIFIFATAMLLMAFVSACVDGICDTFFENSIHYYLIYLGVLLVFILIVLLPIIYIFIKQISEVVFEYKNKKVWRVLWIIPITFTFILVLFPVFTPIDYLYANLILNSGGLVVYQIIFTMMKQSVLAERLQEENRLKEKMLLIEQSQYNTLFSGIEQARLAKHDLRHHFNAIMSYSKSNQPEMLQAYIEQYLSTQQEDSLIIYCENSVLNKLLSYYHLLAKKHEIKTDFVAVMSDIVAISEPDLWVLFGNCLENAIEACNRFEGVNKRIKLTVKQQGNMLGIVIDNTYQCEIKKDKDNHFISSKDNLRTGIGLQSVQSIVDNYQGILEINYDSKVFVVSIMLCLF